MARFVEREIRAYLECGVRRMTDTAAHLVDRVLPEVPVRQWVLTLPYPLPYPLRYRCAWSAQLTTEFLRCFLRAVFADQRRRAAWADLLQRVFEVDALRCPGCGGRMRVLWAITDPHVARRILECLKLPPRAPPLTPAREPELDDAPDFGPSSGSIDEVDPGFEFDQSVPETGCP